MEGVEIGSELFLVAVSAGRRTFHLPGDVLHLCDLVSHVTVDTYRHSRVAGFQLSAMDAREILGFRAAVARAAGRRDVRSVRPAVGIRVAKNFVCSVTTGTGSCNEQTVLGQREAVDGIHVQRIDIGNAKFPRRLRISMTRSTSLGYV
jgi:hypothetical protein